MIIILYTLLRKLKQKVKPRIKTTRIFKTYSKTEFVKDLNNIPWDTIRLFHDVNDGVFAWNKLFLDVVNKHAPLKQIRMKGSNKTWVTCAITTMMKERDILLRKVKKTKCTHDWAIYCKFKNLVNMRFKNAESDYYKELLLSSINPRNTLNILNQLLGKKSNLGKALIHIEKDKIVQPKIVADLFNKYFASIAKVISEKLYHSFPGSDWVAI